MNKNEADGGETGGNMHEIMSFTSFGWGPGDNYKISLIPEDDVYYLRGERSRQKRWEEKPQALRHTVKVSADWVNNLLSKLKNANIPLWPPEALGCDGDFYTLSIGSSYGGATYKWWSAPPVGWEIFPKVARQIIDEFSKGLPK